MRRCTLTLAAGLAVVLMTAATALAGGWATTEFDEPLPEFTAGGTWLIGFTILQHGVTPAVVDGPGLRFTSENAGNVLLFGAEPVGADGHYAASVARLPAGVWSLEVEQGELLRGRDGAPTGLHFAPYRVGTVTVAAAPSAVGAASDPGPAKPITVTEAAMSPLLFAALVAVISACIVAAYGIVRRRGGATATGGVEYGHIEEETA